VSATFEFLLSYNASTVDVLVLQVFNTCQADPLYPAFPGICADGRSLRQLADFPVS
jgi:hypothetical protein